MYMVQSHVEKVFNEVKKYKYNYSIPVEKVIWKKGTFKGGENPSLDVSDWKPYCKGDKWNGFLEHSWFRAEIEMPKELAGHDAVLEVTTGCEGFWDFINPQMLGYVDGKLIHALDQNHREIIIAKNVKAGQKLLVALYVYSGRDKESPAIELNMTLRGVNSNVVDLIYNIDVPLQTAKILPEQSKDKQSILRCLNSAINLLDFRKPGSKLFFDSVDKANQYLEKEFYGKECHVTTPIFHSVGHSHLDVAWGWTVTETREKAVRTFANMLDLMERFPSYTYIQSQPVLYKFVKEQEPELFEKVKEYVKEGRWEPEGAMWLEADCNLTSGESLVRQILFGKRFFKSEFDKDSKVLWLPDVFGYSAAIPQILKKSGVDYFMTTKIGWNEYNKMPCETFEWEGIDGSKVLTQLVPSYGSAVWAHEFKDAYEAYPEKLANDEMLFMYGFSDGGGGASDEMVERHMRFEKGIPGLPSVKQSSVNSFFRSIENNFKENEKLPISRHLPRWVGELYLEYHRGTYTSVARNKKNNRRSELLYKNIELFSVMRDILCKNEKYPQDMINKNWELILLNQFHDIIPGSSVEAVYEESDIDYRKILDEGKQMLDNALMDISVRDKEADKKNADADKNEVIKSVTVFNANGFEGAGYVCVPQGDLDDIDINKCVCTDEEGNFNSPLQLLEKLSPEGAWTTYVLFEVKDVPQNGFKKFIIKPRDTVTHLNVIYDIETDENGMKFSTDYYKISLDNKGRFTSIYDRHNNREVLKEGGLGNKLTAFEDMPLAFNSWDINLFYQEKNWDIEDVKSIKIVENGELCSTIVIESEFMSSTIKQKVFFYKNSNQIDFDTDIDWHEQQVLLKTGFDTNVHNNEATYDIQFGNVKRPTHYNTPWDEAKFEVCAHKWADLSEDNYGVSLLNNCKYGHDIKDGCLRLTLIKSSGGWPFPLADNERHAFSYSFVPHEGDWKKAAIHKQATFFNNPMFARLDESRKQKPFFADVFSLITANVENVCIDTVKMAEDEKAVIVRMYEYMNRRCNVELLLNDCFKPVNIVECDLLENNIDSTITTDEENTTISFEIKPYEIKTFKIQLQ